MIRRLAFIFLLIPLSLLGQTDPSGRAVERAKGIFRGDSGEISASIRQKDILPIGPAERPVAYVITFEPKGFAIVSANGSNPAVWAYSDSSEFPEDPLHPLRQWLLPLMESSAYAPLARKSGQNIKFTTDRMVLPLVSAQWGQGDSWNRFCPADSSGKRALAGCVAVAMAQIMEKWHWPPQGYGEVSYTPLQHPEYGEITARFDTTRYRWDLTHDLYPTDAAALVLFHAGASTFMTYDPVLSSTSVDRFALPALIGNFLYNRGMVFRQMEPSKMDEWTRMLRQELDNSRPVLYAGTSPDGKSSHAFNIDGYRNDSWFHFNWGWNGAGNGWFMLDRMAGGGADFSTQQGAIFGIQPAGIPLHDRPSALDVLAGDGFARLFWEKPVSADFSHFNIYRDGAIAGQTADTEYLDEGLQNGQDYSYRVTAVYQGENPGESPPTPELTIQPWSRLEPGYEQLFENGPAGWQLLENPSGFRIGTADEFQMGGNDTRFAAIRSEGHAPGEQVNDLLTSPPIYPGEHAWLAISFDYMFRQFPGTDSLTLLWREFENGEWNILYRLDSTGGYSDWRNLHLYLPESKTNGPIQIAFRYNDFFGQGFGAAIDHFRLYEVLQPAVPQWSLSSDDLCLSESVVITDLSTGTISSWAWDFGEGAEPRYANTPGPHVVSYTNAGFKTIRLSLNHLDHLTVPMALRARDLPDASFEYYRRFQDIIFLNRSVHGEQFIWDFGDGTTSTETNPVHTYLTKSLFQVRQIAYNGPCQPDTLTVYVDLRNGTGIGDEDLLSGITVYPNPTSGKVNIRWETLPESTVTVRLQSAHGQVILTSEYVVQQELTLDINNFPNGLYILQITSGKKIRHEQILKLNNQRPSN